MSEYTSNKKLTDFFVNKAMELKRLALKLRRCQLCKKMVESRKEVMGNEHYPCSFVGNDNAKYMFVGIAPGRLNKKFKKKDEKDEAFKYKSGVILQRIFDDFKIKAKDAYITNVVKCNTPKNGIFLDDDVKTCINAFLRYEIKFVQPQKIIVLGQNAKQYFKKFVRCNCQMFYVPHPAIVLRGVVKYETYKNYFNNIFEVKE